VRGKRSLVQIEQADAEHLPLLREKTYAKGGIVSVTSRILVVDMLNKKLPIHLVSGMVVLHAERCVVRHALALSLASCSVWDVISVTPTSTEAFIVRVFREHNKVRICLVSL
jgi:DNA excision repair protein ERCC-4